MERTPASRARRTAAPEYACARTYLPTARASSTAARSSSTLYWVVSSSSPGDIAPPEAMILIWSTSWRSCSRDGPPDLVGPVGDHGEHADVAVEGSGPLRSPALVPVAARLRQRTPGDEQPGTGVEPRGHGLAQPVVGAAGVADGGEALGEALLDPPERPGHDQARRMDPVLLGGVALDGRDVHVGVDQPRHEGAAAEVQRRHAARERPDAAGRSHVPDGGALHHDRRALHGLAAGAVDQQRMGQEHDARHEASCPGAARSATRPRDSSNRRAARRGRAAARVPM